MKLRTPFTFFHIYSIENYFNLRVLPNCISYSTNPHFQTIRRYPRPPICGNLSISPSAKTQLHFLLKIPKIRLESSFPHEKHGGFHMAWAAWIDVLDWFFEPYVYGNMSMGFSVFFEKSSFAGTYQQAFLPNIHV